MPTDDVRCPYCVYENKFMLMYWVDDRFVCVKCGHVVDLMDEGFVCDCSKCRELNRPLQTGT